LRSAGFSRRTQRASWLKSKGAKKFQRVRAKLLVELVPTPKIISELRGWFPKTKIAGWKFEAEGKRADAIAAARKAACRLRDGFVRRQRPGLWRGLRFGGKRRRKRRIWPNPPVLFDALEKLYCA
jgi:hypothetical protein